MPIGEADDEYRAICAHEPPRQPRCQNRAESHLLVEFCGTTITLATCQEHRRIALASAAALDEHDHSGLCGLPGTAWNFTTKQCEIDDSGEEPVMAMTAASAQQQPAPPQHDDTDEKQGQ